METALVMPKIENTKNMKAWFLQSSSAKFHYYHCLQQFKLMPSTALPFSMCLIFASNAATATPLLLHLPLWNHIIHHRHIIVFLFLLLALCFYTPSSIFPAHTHTHTKKMLSEICLCLTAGCAVFKTPSYLHCEPNPLNLKWVWQCKFSLPEWLHSIMLISRCHSRRKTWWGGLLVIWRRKITNTVSLERKYILCNEKRPRAEQKRQESKTTTTAGTSL